MARLKNYMYSINKTTIGFKWCWILYYKISYKLKTNRPT